MREWTINERRRRMTKLTGREYITTGGKQGQQNNSRKRDAENQDNKSKERKKRVRDVIGVKLLNHSKDIRIDEIKTWRVVVDHEAEGPI